MTYYEELGISAAASDEEIRHAHKRLIELVHPDQYTDDHMRRLAELQTKRLNDIVEVLFDPASRDRYDRSLMSLALAVSGEAASPSQLEPGRLVPAVIAITAALLILVLGAVRGVSPVPISPVRQPSPPALDDDWEPLATYAYEAHLPVPPIPFPDTLAPAKTASSVESSTAPSR